MVLLTIPVAYSKESDIEVQSTQGIELNSQIEKSKPTKENINEQKEIKNRSKKYIRIQKKLNKQNQRKIEKQNMIEVIREDV